MHGGGRQRRSDAPMSHLSKSLSWLLRHGAEQEGFQFLPGGYLYVDDIMQKSQFRKFTVDDVRSVVTSNDKQRFHLENEAETGRLKIRANQGHSIEVPDLELEPIISDENYPIVIHGTYYKCWQSIRQQGLNRMTRTHMHFAAGLPGESGVISGMRSTCDLVIYIDMAKALADGITFFCSANNVILSQGNKQGVILPKYFQKVVDRKKGEELDLSDLHPWADPTLRRGEEATAVGATFDSTPVSAEDQADKLQSSRKHRRKKKQQPPDTKL